VFNCSFFCIKGVKTWQFSSVASVCIRTVQWVSGPQDFRFYKSLEIYLIDMIQIFLNKNPRAKSFVFRNCNLLVCLLQIAGFFEWKALRYSRGLYLWNQERTCTILRQKFLSKNSKYHSGNHPYLAEYSTLKCLFYCPIFQPKWKCFL